MKQFGLFKRERGLANSKSIEPVFLCWKGLVPRCVAKHRVYVDAGSTIFHQIMKSVPILPPKQQAYVSSDVRDKSLATMIGVASTEDEAEKEKKVRADAEAAAEAAAEATAAEATGEAGVHQPVPQLALEDVPGETPVDEETQARVESVIKKRKLYRHTTGTMLPWFPHDNDPELLRELLHEAGNPRWMFHGTPAGAGAAGIHGCLEAGASVVMLCFDEHHRTHLRKCMPHRSVETLVAGTSLVFKDDALQTRSVDLQLSRAASADDDAVPKEKKTGKKTGKKTDGDAVPEPKKKAKAASNKAAKSKAPTTSTSSSTSDSSSEAAPANNQKQKIDRSRP